MSEIKPEASDESDTGEEKDWAAAKAFFDNLKTKTPRPPKPKYAVTIAVSSRTLFNMVAERKIYEEQGVEKYVAHQVEHENEPLMPGVSFPFVKALMTVNSRLRELYPDSEELFDIVLMTNNNHAQFGIRLENSINHYNLTIERFLVTGGQSPIGYLNAYMTNLYLSKDPEKVKKAIEEGIAAATMFTPNKELELYDSNDTQLRVAFDGDAVLFSDESEIIAKHCLDKFFENEKEFENKALGKGPLKCFLEALVKLQKKFYAKDEPCPIRTFLVTARGAASSGARVLKTLRSWGLEMDEAFFLAGAPKGPLLEKIKPHIFFDDQMKHVEGANKLGIIAAHVPYGI